MERISDKKSYLFNWRDTYHGTKEKTTVEANSIGEAVRKFADIVALGGVGTANAYVVSISPNDGYIRNYGTVSNLLKIITDSSDEDVKYSLEIEKEGDETMREEATRTVETKDSKPFKIKDMKSGRTFIVHANDSLSAVKKLRDAKDSLGSDVDKYQKWVDYDMKRYGKISEETMSELKKAGLKVVKDKYGDYEVIV